MRVLASRVSQLRRLCACLRPAALTPGRGAAARDRPSTRERRRSVASQGRVLSDIRPLAKLPELAPPQSPYTCTASEAEAHNRGLMTGDTPPQLVSDALRRRQSGHRCHRSELSRQVMLRDNIQYAYSRGQASHLCPHCTRRLPAHPSSEGRMQTN